MLEILRTKHTVRKCTYKILYDFIFFVKEKS